MIQYVTYCTKLFYLQVKLEIGKIGLLLHRMNDLMNYTKKKWRTQNCSLFMSSECRVRDNNNNISLYAITFVNNLHYINCFQMIIPFLFTDNCWAQHGKSISLRMDLQNACDNIETNLQWTSHEVGVLE